MKAGLVDGVVAHVKDADVLKALRAAKRKIGGSSDSVIAIKNEADQIYRYAVINGLQQEIYLAERMEPLGLVDETIQGGRKPRGIWAVYGRGRDLSLAGVLAELERKQR
ncbi:hypothetical protein [Hydrogenophaga palleronii]|uniref:hypothetical protein n=1 Tax=Hydrogenophaga palleronii TaxID=65655 RepID=UPI000A41E88F|nr:hypothetical protein [Hydrogenophaga palleronii]